MHVPDAATAAVPEMVRVVRPADGSASSDFDGDSLIVSAARTGALTRRIVAAFSDHGAVDGWLVRRLPGLLGRAGLSDVANPAPSCRSSAEAGRLQWAGDGRAGGRRGRRQVGAITESEREGWLAALRAEQAAGNVLGGRVHILLPPGVKP